MSIKYSLAEMKNPQDSMAPAKFYAKCQIREEIDLDRIATEIAYSSTLTDGDVMNVLKVLIHNMNAHLADGDCVSLGSFGKFQYQLSSHGVESKEDFTHAHIKRVRIQFRPGMPVRPDVKNLKFERVMSVKTRREAKKIG